MPPLTPQQIQALLQSAQSAGLDRVSLEALREGLTMQNASLTGEQRFDLEVMQTPQDTQERLKDFTAGFSELSQGVMSKGKAGLMALSEEEWEAMLNRG